MRFLMLTATLTIATVMPVRMMGQAGTGSPVPRTPDGHPDLTGMYDLAMLTPLERPTGLPAVLSDAAAAQLERSIADQERKARGPIRGDREAHYEAVGRVVFGCQRAGIVKVGFILEPPPRGG